MIVNKKHPVAERCWGGREPLKWIGFPRRNT